MLCSGGEILRNVLNNGRYARIAPLEEGRGGKLY